MAFLYKRLAGKIDTFVLVWDDYEILRCLASVVWSMPRNFTGSTRSTGKIAHERNFRAHDLFRDCICTWPLDQKEQ